jgi:deoxyribonuclease V
VRWPYDALSIADAIALQRTLAAQVIRRGRPRVRRVTGVDCAFDAGGTSCRAAAVVWDVQGRCEVTSSVASEPCRFPYVPGLLAFRELPAILSVLDALDADFDAVLVDGQGIAHPRRLGIASHLGLLLDRPVVGCAKSRLVGEYVEPATVRGSCTQLVARGEVVGAVLRTRDGVSPVFVSVGHRIALDAAVALVLACHEGYRIPAPTRRADIRLRRPRTSPSATNQRSR